MLDDKTRETFFVEIHSEIWDSSARAIDLIRNTKTKENSLVYPPRPDGFMTPQEVLALRRIAESDVACSAVKKLVADACAGAFFHMFALMDAVGDPQLAEVEEWFGIDMTRVDPDTAESRGLMLHDELFDSYWRFKELSEGTRGREG